MSYNTADVDNAGRQDEHAGGTSRNRRIVIWVLIVGATLIGFFAATNFWLDQQALDTDNWVEASDKLLQDPAVQEQLSTYLVNELYEAVDLKSAIAGLLPPELQGLAGLAAGAVRQPATDAIESLLRTEQFRALWRTANREAHTLVVRVLEGGTDVVSTEGGVVSLNVGELVHEVGGHLGLSESTLDRIPEDAGLIVLATSNELAGLQGWVTFVKAMSAFLLIVVVGIYALALYLAVGERRETLRTVGWSVVVLGLLLLIGRRIGINSLVSQIDNPANEPAALAAAGTGTELLAQMAWASFVYGAVTVLGAALMGPTRLATSTRRIAAPALNAPAVWVWGGAAIVFVLLVLWAPLPAFNTWYTVLILGVLLALGLAAVRRQTLREFPIAWHT